MAQMVLPQTLVPGTQKDSGPVKSGSEKEASRSDSRFESVSRAEQKRMDQKKADSADKTEEPRPDDTHQGDNNASETASASSDSTRKPGGADGKKSAGNSDDEVSENATPMTAPLTFADLQALLAPVSSQTTAEGTTSGAFSTPGVLTPGGLMNGVLNGKPGAPGQGLSSQLTSQLTSGLKLTDALTGTLSADGGRGSDAASLLTSAKFQTTMDMAAQQATKLSADAALPLKGYATSIDLPVGHGDWGDKMAGKLSWLTARGMSVAEIHLTPPDMGPMEVKVKLHHDQATITVHAANPVVRDQLEVNSHRLRDMLAEQGVNLAQFDVSDSSQQQGGEQAAGENQGSGGSNPSDMSAGVDTDEMGLNSGHLDLSWKGEVDIFA